MQRAAAADATLPVDFQRHRARIASPAFGGELPVKRKAGVAVIVIDRAEDDEPGLAITGLQQLRAALAVASPGLCSGRSGPDLDFQPARVRVARQDAGGGLFPPGALAVTCGQ